MKILKVLTILGILTISSGCSIFKPTPYAPLCLERDVILKPISVEEQLFIRDENPDLLFRLAYNDEALKSVIKKYEAQAKQHNRIYGVDCEED